jgi:hypothetical protein
MEISYLTRQIVENHDRILPEKMEKDDQAWKFGPISVKTEKFLIGVCAGDDPAAWN